MQTPASADERHPVGNVRFIVVALQGTGRSLAVYLEVSLWGIHSFVVAGDTVAVEVDVAVNYIPHMLIVEADLDVGVADLSVIYLLVCDKLQLGIAAGDLFIVDVFIGVDAEEVGLAVLKA